MNFVYISPNFPDAAWKFCAALKNNGVNVLGIGDQPYEELRQELKDALAEYYKVSNLENYDEVYRGVAHFAWKHGRIDWLESNNEYWLEQDARLRTDFNICTGIKTDHIDAIKEKSEMKKYYAKGGIRTARQIKASAGLKKVLRFAEDAGYPLFAKPDVGVGACGTAKLENEAQLEAFFKGNNVGDYVIEEYVTGNICDYDAIIDSKGEPIFESWSVCPPSIADIVKDNLDSVYYVEKDMNENLRYWGRQTVKAFGVQSRFVHLEFFRLDRAHRGLGNVGDFVALEVNMRPGGGFTPDMLNYAHSTDVYKIWADMVAFDQRTVPDSNDDWFCVFAGRRDGVKYRLNHEQMMEKYSKALQQWDRVPDALSGAMGNQSYICRFRTEEEKDAFLADIYDRITE
ncbi:MAG: carbamoylphosphate synthase large subunit [Bacteroidaceae bacterium]|nr:carbamoylphosphate synthase large subunit [Bacteroidaceae bacterium]